MALRVRAPRLETFVSIGGTLCASAGSARIPEADVWHGFSLSVTVRELLMLGTVVLSKSIFRRLNKKLDKMISKYSRIVDAVCH